MLFWLSIPESYFASVFLKATSVYAIAAYALDAEYSKKAIGGMTIPVFDRQCLEAIGCQTVRLGKG